MEKNQDIVMAKELFNAWDEDKHGYITFEKMAENLISIGLAATKI